MISFSICYYVLLTVIFNNVVLKAILDFFKRIIDIANFQCLFENSCYTMYLKVWLTLLSPVNVLIFLV